MGTTGELVSLIGLTLFGDIGHCFAFTAIDWIVSGEGFQCTQKFVVQAVKFFVIFGCFEGCRKLFEGVVSP